MADAWPIQKVIQLASGDLQTDYGQHTKAAVSCCGEEGESRLLKRLAILRQLWGCVQIIIHRLDRVGEKIGTPIRLPPSRHTKVDPAGLLDCQQAAVPPCRDHPPGTTPPPIPIGGAGTARAKYLGGSPSSPVQPKQPGPAGQWGHEPNTPHWVVELLGWEGWRRRGNDKASGGAMTVQRRPPLRHPRPKRGGI